MVGNDVMRNKGCNCGMLDAIGLVALVILENEHMMIMFDFASQRSGVLPSPRETKMLQDFLQD